MPREQQLSVGNNKNMNQVGRNDPCPCGSGRKYKQCCMGKQLAAAPQPVRRLDPAELPRLFQMAVEHFQSGRLQEAEAALKQLLQVSPKHADALHLAGLVAYQSGRAAEAASLMGKSLKLERGNANCHSNLGLALQAQGKLSEAVASYRQAIALQPGHAQAHCNLANALQLQGLLERAGESYGRALALLPDYAEAHNGLGNVLLLQGRAQAAAEAYARAITLQPAYAVAHCNLGNALRQTGDLEGAIASYRQAIAVDPAHAPAHSQLGNVLELQDRLDEAEASLRRAIEIRPDYAVALSNLGNVLQRQGRLDEAADCHRRSIACSPTLATSHDNLGNVLLDQGFVDEAIASYRKALSLNPDSPATFSNLLMAIQYGSDSDPARILAEHQAYARRFEAPLRKSWRPHDNSRDPARPLCVGFVSGDLREHPVGYFIEGVLSALQGEGVQVVLYPTSVQRDALSERLRNMGHAWHSLAGLPDELAAERIRQDGIDILVDLSGHTAGNRLPLFARKPAPVQVAWLGYWATTGLQAMDYILCDPWVLPEAERSQFVEQPCYLPETRMCFTPPADAPSVAALPALASGSVTFGCFNNLSKVGDAVVALWARVLDAVPGSRLLLMSKQLASPSECQSVLARFAACGVPAERLILQPPVPRAEYLASYGRVDMVLDPFPFTGATTSIEGLWMGVPFITRRGDRLVAHQGEGILQNLGLQDWIAADDDDYVACAVRHAADLASLAGLRAQLRERLRVSPLCDAPRFARHFELALRGMWERYCENA